MAPLVLVGGGGPCRRYCRGVSAPFWGETPPATQVSPDEAVALARDIFGNPFRPATGDPEWLTSTVVAIARGMYESGDFSAMPILADALQDAGCDSDDVLDHCREGGRHARGCWVVDLVLGKA